MDKTIHPLLSQYSSTKWGEGRGGGTYLSGGAYFKFWPIGGALIRRGHLFEGALIRGFTVPKITFKEINLRIRRVWRINPLTCTLHAVLESFNLN